MDLKKIDLDRLQDYYVFTANEIATAPMVSGNTEFINFKCLDNEVIVPTVKAIPLDKVKQVVEEIGNLPVEYSTLIDGEKVLAILDRLIESES
jgi:hypothetical protein